MEGVEWSTFFVIGYTNACFQDEGRDFVLRAKARQTSKHGWKFWGTHLRNTWWVAAHNLPVHVPLVVVLTDLNACSDNLIYKINYKRFLPFLIHWKTFICKKKKKFSWYLSFQVSFGRFYGEWAFCQELIFLEWSWTQTLEEKHFAVVLSPFQKQVETSQKLLAFL